MARLELPPGRKGEHRKRGGEAIPQQDKQEGCTGNPQGELPNGGKHF